MRTEASRSSAARDIQSVPSGLTGSGAPVAPMVVVPSEAPVTRLKSKFTPLFQDFLYGDRSGMGTAASRSTAARDIQSVPSGLTGSGAPAAPAAPAAPVAPPTGLSEE